MTGFRDGDAESQDDLANDVQPRGRESSTSLFTPKVTYLLIGGAALGVIVLMCLVVGLLIALQGS